LAASETLTRCGAGGRAHRPARRPQHRKRRATARRLRTLLGDRGCARRATQAARPTVRPHLAGRRHDRRRQAESAVRALLPDCRGHPGDQRNPLNTDRRSEV